MAGIKVGTSGQIQQVNSSHLILTVRIANGGGDFQVGLIQTGGTSYSIDWGDGSVESKLNGNQTHTYADAGVEKDYTVKINSINDSAPITWVRFDDSLHEQKIRDIQQWGITKWTDFRNFLREQSATISADVTAPDVPDLSSVTDLRGMFEGDGELINTNGSISRWNTGNIQLFNTLFKNCNQFTQNLSNWNILSATNMTDFLAGSGLSNNTYTDTIVGWATQVYGNSGQPNNISFTGASKTFQNSRTADEASGLNYSAKYSNWGDTGWSDAEDAYDYLTSTRGWTIN